MSKYVCSICGFVYDESMGTKWEELPDNWTCPLCGASKAAFRMETEEPKKETGKTESVIPSVSLKAHSEMREMTFADLSAVCSNLARGCEKQYLSEESDLFTKLSNYYAAKAEPVASEQIEELLVRINKDLEENFQVANQAAQEAADRGAKRALTWSEKVTRILDSLLKRYENEGTALLERTKVWVCEICGFIYIGDVPPDICPICKVPNMKITEVKSV